MAEDNYWDRIAAVRQDNVWKRAQIVRRLLALDMIEQDVLEIGVGLGTAAAAINIAYLGCWRYQGTDVSAKNVALVKRWFGLDIVQASIDRMPFRPDRSVDVVWALDTLEHVKDKAAGYAEIDRVLRPYARIVLNIPLDESAHDPEQEHGFTNSDYHHLLTATRMETETWEQYTVRIPDAPPRHYAWAVAAR